MALSGSVPGPGAPDGVESGELAEPTQKRPRCGPDPDEMFHRLSELMTREIQVALTPEQFENAKSALGLLYNVRKITFAL